MTQKQLNLDDYDKDTINQFDTVGTYFVKVFYKTLHDRAKDEMFSGSKHKSITDAYRGWVVKYVNMLGKSVTFDEISAQIFSYYCEGTMLHTNRTDFIMGFTQLFVPMDYHDNLNMMGYITLYKQIITDVVKLFAKEITDNYIKQIIDDHKNKTNVRILQEKIITIFCYYKDNLIQKFVRKAITVGMGGTGVKVNDNIELKNKFRQLLKNNLTYKKMLYKRMVYIKSLEIQLRLLQNEILQLNGSATLPTLPTIPENAPVDKISNNNESDNTTKPKGFTDAFPSVESPPPESNEVAIDMSDVNEAENIPFTETVNNDSKHVDYRPITETHVQIGDFNFNE